MPPRPHRYWKPLWRGLAILLGLLLLLYAGLLGYLTYTRGQCRNEGREIVTWIETERIHTGHLPDHIARPSRFHWNYRVDDAAQNYYLYAYSSPGSRITLDYDSASKQWIVNKDN